MIAAALDVDRAEVDHALEAVRQRRPVEAARFVPGTGTWKSTLRSWLSIISSFLYSGSPPMPWSTGADADQLEQVRVAEGEVERDHELDLVAVDLDLDALRLESPRAARRV